MNFDYNKQLKTLTMIILSNFHCIHFFFRVITFLVMSCLSLCLCIPQFIIAIAGMIMSQDWYNGSYNPNEDIQCKKHHLI
jgi:hypothetical protein